MTGDLDLALGAWDTFQVSHDALHVHLVALGWIQDLACCLLHVAHDVASFLAHVQQLLHSCAVHRSSLVFQLDQGLCRWRSLGPRLRPVLRRPVQEGSHIAGVPRIRFNRVSTSCRHDHSAKEENWSLSCASRPTLRTMTCADRCFIDRYICESVINMNAHVYVQFSVAEATRFRQEWAEIQTFQESHNICCVHINCKGNVVTSSCRFRSKELIANIGFSGRAEPAGVSANISGCSAVIMIEIIQNQSGLDAVVLLTINPAQRPTDALPTPEKLGSFFRNIFRFDKLAKHENLVKGLMLTNSVRSYSTTRRSTAPIEGKNSSLSPLNSTPQHPQHAAPYASRHTVHHAL